MFSKTSRYYQLPQHTWTGPDGREVVYVGRRVVPRRRRDDGERTVVGPEERLDLVAARVLGRPEAYWRLCDANDVLDPFEISGDAGRVLQVPED